GFDPGVGDSDQGLCQIGVSEADGLEHGACRGAVASVCNVAAAVFRVHESQVILLPIDTEAQRKAGEVFLCVSVPLWLVILDQALTACGFFSATDSVDFFFSAGSHDIIARSFSPTFSIGCCFALSRRAAKFLPPFLFSSIHSFAKVPS